MTYWRQMSILLRFWPTRGIGAADERLGQVHAQHHQLDVGGNRLAGEQRDDNHDHERERYRPDGWLAEQRGTPAVRGGPEHRGHDRAEAGAAADDDAGRRADPGQASPPDAE